MKDWSKRLITMIISSVLVPLAVEKFGVDIDTAWTIVTIILGYLGVETVRPSGTTGFLGGGGQASG